MRRWSKFALSQALMTWKKACLLKQDKRGSRRPEHRQWLVQRSGVVLAQVLTSHAVCCMRRVWQGWEEEMSRLRHQRQERMNLAWRVGRLSSDRLTCLSCYTFNLWATASHMAASHAFKRKSSGSRRSCFTRKNLQMESSDARGFVPRLRRATPIPAQDIRGTNEMAEQSTQHKPIEKRAHIAGLASRGH